MNKLKKKFDAVNTMRLIRDEISREIEGMTLEEECQWLATRKISDPFLDRLRKRIHQPQ
jgi:hypothetical protein